MLFYLQGKNNTADHSFPTTDKNQNYMIIWALILSIESIIRQELLISLINLSSKELSSEYPKVIVSPWPKNLTIYSQTYKKMKAKKLSFLSYIQEIMTLILVKNWLNWSEIFAIETSISWLQNKVHFRRYLQNLKKPYLKRWVWKRCVKISYKSF